MFSFCSNGENAQEYDLRHLLNKHNLKIEENGEKFQKINSSCEAMVEMTEPSLNRNFENQGDNEDLAKSIFNLKMTESKRPPFKLTDAAQVPYAAHLQPSWL